MTHYKYFFIGGGIASISAIKILRKGSFDSIAIVNNESFLPYKRTQLSKKLTGYEIKNEFALLDADWYATNDVELIHNEAVSIDSISKTVLMIDGERYTYDYLVIATGLHPVLPVIPGLQSHDVKVLRNIHHANIIIKSAHTCQDILVIGGGVEGVEIASQMAIIGKKVTIIHKNSRIMSRNLSPQNSNFLEAQAHLFGVKILTNTTILKAEKFDDENYIVFTNTGTYRFDLIIAAIGAIPNVFIAKSCGLELNQGIVVNKYLQTSVPSIYAAGDVVDIPAHKNHHLWHQAEYMGEVVGLNLLGNPTPYEHKEFRLKAEVFDNYLFSLNIEARDLPQCVTKLESCGDKSRILYLVDNKLLGVEMINDNDNAKLYQQAVWERWTEEQIYERITWQSID